MTETIDLYVGEDEIEHVERGGVRYKTLNVEELREGLDTFARSMSSVVSSLKNLPPETQIEKLVLNLGVSAGGKISLLGTGVSASVSSSIALHLKIQKSEKDDEAQ